MTEYTTSPEAIEEYLNSRNRTAGWVSRHNPAQTPFVPPERARTIRSDESVALTLPDDADTWSSHSLPPKMLLRYEDGRPDVPIERHAPPPSALAHHHSHGHPHRDRDRDRDRDRNRDPTRTRSVKGARAPSLAHSRSRSASASAGPPRTRALEPSPSPNRTRTPSFPSHPAPPPIPEDIRILPSRYPDPASVSASAHAPSLHTPTPRRPSNAYPNPNPNAAPSNHSHTPTPYTHPHPHPQSILSPTPQEITIHNPSPQHAYANPLVRPPTAQGQGTIASPSPIVHALSHPLTQYPRYGSAQGYHGATGPTPSPGPSYGAPEMRGGGPTGYDPRYGYATSHSQAPSPPPLPVPYRGPGGMPPGAGAGAPSYLGAAGGSVRARSPPVSYSQSQPVPQAHGYGHGLAHGYGHGQTRYSMGHHPTPPLTPQPGQSRPPSRTASRGPSGAPSGDPSPSTPGPPPTRPRYTSNASGSSKQSHAYSVKPVPLLVSARGASRAGSQPPAIVYAPRRDDASLDERFNPPAILDSQSAPPGRTGFGFHTFPRGGAVGVGRKGSVIREEGPGGMGRRESERRGRPHVPGAASVDSGLDLDMDGEGDGELEKEVRARSRTLSAGQRGVVDDVLRRRRTRSQSRGDGQGGPGGSRSSSSSGSTYYVIPAPGQKVHVLVPDEAIYPPTPLARTPSSRSPTSTSSHAHGPVRGHVHSHSAPIPPISRFHELDDGPAPPHLPPPPAPAHARLVEPFPPVRAGEGGGGKKPGTFLNRFFSGLHLAQKWRAVSPGRVTWAHANGERVERGRRSTPAGGEGAPGGDGGRGPGAGSGGGIDGRGRKLVRRNTNTAAYGSRGREKY